VLYFSIFSIALLVFVIIGLLNRSSDYRLQFFATSALLFAILLMWVVRNAVHDEPPVGDKPVVWAFLVAMTATIILAFAWVQSVIAPTRSRQQ